MAIDITSDCLLMAHFAITKACANVRFIIRFILLTLTMSNKIIKNIIRK